MLTGYNTDITHKGVVYHIQTEDGGETNPFIVSLVYQGGRILASKKTSYKQILGSDSLLSELRQMLEDQHRNMIRAIVKGTLAAEADVQSPPPKEKAAARPGAEGGPAGKAPAAERAPAKREPIKEKNLDQVILEYLASEIEEE